MGATLEKQGPFGRVAPVLIPTCNRWQHFQNLVHSLQACPLAEQTHLHIAVDAPFSETVVEENQRILQISENLTGFARVTIWKRNSNLGAERNIAEAVDQVFQNHDRLIFLEDDNVVANNFLLFMNQALNQFTSDPSCFSISGYHYQKSQTSDPAADFYRAPYFAGWGVGIYRDRYFHPMTKCGNRPSAFFLKPINLWRTYSLIPHLFRMYMEGRLLGKLYGDVFFSIYSMQEGLYNVYPALTKVINRGMDGSGQHCVESSEIIHESFEKEKQQTFNFSPCLAADSHFCKENRKWFAVHQSAPTRHTISLFWRYFTRVVGLRPTPPLVNYRPPQKAEKN
jgi:hypothetical protein